MIDIQMYKQEYETENFKSIIQQRLNEEYGHIPNIQKDETYISILISLHYELSDPNKFYSVIEDSIYEFYNNTNKKALTNTLNLYTHFHQYIEIKDVFPKKLNFSIQDDLKLNLVILQFLQIAKLRKESFWHDCYYNVLAEFQEKQIYTDLLLTIINGLNTYTFLNKADIWTNLYLSFANIHTDTSALLIKIITEQWILCNKDISKMNTLIKTLCSIQESNLKPLKLTLNKNFSRYLKYAVDFLLKHNFQPDQKNILNTFNQSLLELERTIPVEELEITMINLISEQPKYFKASMLEQFSSNNFNSYRNISLTSTLTPAMIMAGD